MTSAGGRAERPERPGRPRWAGFVFIAAVLLAAFVALQSCQERDVRISDAEAIAAARNAIRFEPDQTRVRFVRQGFRSRAFYAVSFSRGKQGEPDAHLTTVLVDARTGAIAEVNEDY